MPQLDLFAYSTLIFSFGSFFFFFLLVGYFLILFFAARIEYCRGYFSVANVFQFVGGTRYLEGSISFLLSREYFIYKFCSFVSQRK